MLSEDQVLGEVRRGREGIRAPVLFLQETNFTEVMHTLDLRVGGGRKLLRRILFQVEEFEFFDLDGSKYSISFQFPLPYGSGGDATQEMGSVQWVVPMERFTGGGKILGFSR